MPSSPVIKAKLKGLWCTSHIFKCLVVSLPLTEFIVIFNIHALVPTGFVVAPLLLIVKTILLTAFVARWTLLFQQEDPEIAPKEGDHHTVVRRNVDCRKEFAFLHSWVVYLVLGLSAVLYFILSGVQFAMHVSRGRRTAVTVQSALSLVDGVVCVLILACIVRAHWRRKREGEIRLEGGPRPLDVPPPVEATAAINDGDILK